MFLLFAAAFQILNGLMCFFKPETFMSLWGAPSAAIGGGMALILPFYAQFSIFTGLFYYQVSTLDEKTSRRFMQPIVAISTVISLYTAYSVTYATTSPLIFTVVWLAVQLSLRFIELAKSNHFWPNEVWHSSEHPIDINKYHIIKEKTHHSVCVLLDENSPTHLDLDKLYDTDSACEGIDSIR
jgi:hypothetical protein